MFKKWYSCLLQIYPNLSGMLLRLRQKQFNIQLTTVSKTFGTYLPTLTTKATDPQTIYLYLKCFQGLAKEMSIPHVNVTLGVLATINAYKLFWKYSQQLFNVIMQLGDFHMIKENYKIVMLLLQFSCWRNCIPDLNVSFWECVWIYEWWSLQPSVENSRSSIEHVLYKRFLHEKHPNISNKLIDLAPDDIDVVMFETLWRG